MTFLERKKRPLLKPSIFEDFECNRLAIKENKDVMIGIMNNLQLLVFDNEKALDWNNEYPCSI